MRHQTKHIIILTAVATVATLAIVNRQKLKSAAATAVSNIKKLFMGKYFTISELCRSDEARKHNIDNQPSPIVQARLESLVTNCLDPIRERYGKAIIVSSGYRSEALNKVVGGVANSQHLTGEAADLVPASGGNLSDIFRAALQHGNFDQLILENNNRGAKWVHVSFTTQRALRRQILLYDGGKYYDISTSYEKYL